MAMTLITNSADTDSTDLANVSFTTGIDSTYKLYIFKFIDINVATDGAEFTFNGSDDTSSWSYDIIKTTTSFNVYREESAGTGAGYGVLDYGAPRDLAQSTAYCQIGVSLDNPADSSCVGTLLLFNPSSTTYVKHFQVETQYMGNDSYSETRFSAGYFNATAAITALDFKCDEGNFDGTIKMYGVG